MKTRPLAAALILALMPATYPAAVFAQAPAEDATTAMARARFKEGVEFYDKSEYEQARASFLQAYALKKHPAVLLNLAWSCVKSGHALEGERYFRQFLAEGKEITDKQRADANDGLTQARNKLGRIEIAAATGTEVTVDGEKVGMAPIADPIAVEAGAHTVKFKGPDGSTDTQSVTVLGGEKAVAHFGKSGGGAVATANPPPANTATEPTPSPTSTEAKTEETPKTDEAPKKEAPESTSDTYFVPESIVPVIVLGAVSLAGFITAGVLVGSKNSAQTQANTTANEIVSHGGGSQSCTQAGLAAHPEFAQACNAYITDNNQVNQDATAANVAVAVGIAAPIAAGIYWVLAPKRHRSGTASTSTPVVTPIIGRGQGGLSLDWKF